MLKKLLTIAALMLLVGAGCAAPQPAAERQPPVSAPTVAPPVESATSTTQAPAIDTADHLDAALDDLNSVK